jgi:prepilin-type N-terminal cleavage/methylation domain-containing protein
MVWLSRLRSRPIGLQGFTLIELLIVVAIAGLIISTLLSLVVELASTEQRESARTESQRDVQLALDYITSDLKEAIYVYDNGAHPNNAGSVPRYWGYIPQSVRNNGAIPILAFWKTKYINPNEEGLPPSSLPFASSRNPPVSSNCSIAFGSGDTRDSLKLSRVIECNNLWEKRRTYSLVVYTQIAGQTGAWRGESRILRYEFDRYTTVSTLTRTGGFVDPAELYPASKEGSSESFATWPFLNAINCQNSTSYTTTQSCNGASNPGSIITSASPSVLVDFIDRPDAIRDASNSFSCPSSTHQDTSLASSTSTSFKVCIRDISAVTNNSEPQDIIVHLRGNAKGRPGIAKDTFLPALQTRIAMRGIIDRRVN